ncbi:MAG TPA: hypothetical protein VGI75_12075, partial [Pirellulales bacterium]
MRILASGSGVLAPVDVELLDEVDALPALEPELVPEDSVDSETDVEVELSGPPNPGTAGKLTEMPNPGTLDSEPVDLLGADEPPAPAPLPP